MIPGLVDLIFLRFGGGIILFEIPKITPLDFVLDVILDEFPKLVLPVMIGLKRTPLLPALAVGTRLDGPGMRDDQAVSATFFA